MHDDFKIISNGKELSFPMFRLFAMAALGFMLGVTLCWSASNNPSYISAAPAMIVSFLLGGLAMCWFLIISKIVRT